MKTVLYLREIEEAYFFKDRNKEKAVLDNATEILKNKPKRDSVIHNSVILRRV